MIHYHVNIGQILMIISDFEGNSKIEYLKFIL